MWIMPVSYTHLDVYKRQFLNCIGFLTQVHIMETIIFDSHFLHEFKAVIHLILGSLHLIGITVPR